MTLSRGLSCSYKLSVQDTRLTTCTVGCCLSAYAYRRTQADCYYNTGLKMVRSSLSAHAHVGAIHWSTLVRENASIPLQGLICACNMADSSVLRESYVYNMQ